MRIDSHGITRGAFDNTEASREDQNHGESRKDRLAGRVGIGRGCFAPVFATPTSSGAGVLAAPLVSAPAVAGDAILTFSEFPVGTVITTQYAADGVVFSALTGNAPIIANDGAMPDFPF